MGEQNIAHIINVIKESHPEVCFARLSGEVIPSEPMKDENGLIMQMVIPAEHI